MDKYVRGDAIRRLREERKLTQEQLGEKIFVSSKTISKWEKGHGLPDISLLEPLSEALGISVIELFSGESIKNDNRSANMVRSMFYVCPICGNVILSSGEAVISCCGVMLPPLEAEETDCGHLISVEIVEDEYYVKAAHSATKEHYLSFFAAVSDMGIQLAKLYPESDAEARFKINRVKWIYAYCNRHGLFKIKV